MPPSEDVMDVLLQVPNRMCAITAISAMRIEQVGTMKLRTDEGQVYVLIEPHAEQLSQSWVGDARGVNNAGQTVYPNGMA